VKPMALPEKAVLELPLWVSSSKPIDWRAHGRIGVPISFAAPPHRPVDWQDSCYEDCKRQWSLCNAHQSTPFGFPACAIEYNDCLKTCKEPPPLPQCASGLFPCGTTCCKEDTVCCPPPFGAHGGTCCYSGEGCINGRCQEVPTNPFRKNLCQGFDPPRVYCVGTWGPACCPPNFLCCDGICYTMSGPLPPKCCGEGYPSNVCFGNARCDVIKGCTLN
jgi:hypothetical protein